MYGYPKNDRFEEEQNLDRPSTPSDYRSPVHRMVAAAMVHALLEDRPYTSVETRKVVRLSDD